MAQGQQQQPSQLPSPQEQHIRLSDAHDKYHPNNNTAAYRSEHPADYHREQVYQQLDGGNNNNNNNNKSTLGIHLNVDSNGEYDETMSNNEDNCSVKDLSPGLQGSKGTDPSKGYSQALRVYADSCDISSTAQMNKPSYECSANGIRPRNFKDMQSPSGDGMEMVGGPATNEGLVGYMERGEQQQGEEHRRIGKGSEGAINNNNNGDNLRTYSSSEDLNQTISSEHGGEKITSGSDDEGGFPRGSTINKSALIQCGSRKLNLFS